MSKITEACAAFKNGHITFQSKNNLAVIKVWKCSENIEILAQDWKLIEVASGT